MNRELDVCNLLKPFASETTTAIMMIDKTKKMVNVMNMALLMLFIMKNKIKKIAMDKIDIPNKISIAHLKGSRI